MSDDREKLKALLLSEEIAQIKALQKLLDDKQALSELISEVLDPATDIAIEKNPNFQKKFSKIDSKTYVRAIKANKQTFIDALLPIIGPIIRKSVTSSIRRFVADINSRLEVGFSPKALKWRWKAFRTGIPFAEIVFNNTIEYQVKQVFLIDNHTGLLIAHAGHEEALLQDKDAMSAMLTAIQDFVKDSVSADGEGLSAAEIDDDILWITSGNKAKIAAIIKGAPTQRLRNVMMTASEDLHIEFHNELLSEEVWGNSPELEAELEKLLLTKSQSEDEKSSKSINFWPWIIILSGLLFWWGWTSYKHHQEELNIHQMLTNTPGFLLTDLAYDDDKFIATGLQDPLSTPRFRSPNLLINSSPYLSLEPPIVQKRVEKLLNDNALSVSVLNGTVKVSGIVVDKEAYLEKLKMIESQPGIDQVIDEVNTVPLMTLESYLQNNLTPNTLSISQKSDGSIVLTGFTKKELLQNLITELEPLGKIKSEQVEVINIQAVKTFIKQNPINIVSTSSLNSQQKNQLDKISNQFLQLVALENNGTIKLTSQSDCQGSIEKSNENNQMRLDLVKNYLLTQGLQKTQIMNQIIKCDIATEDIKQSKIGVWLEVVK